MSAAVAPRRFLVTGGASGIGAAIVRALAGSGLGVDFTYRASAEAAQALLALGVLQTGRRRAPRATTH